MGLLAVLLSVPLALALPAASTATTEPAAVAARPDPTQTAFDAVEKCRDLPGLHAGDRYADGRVSLTFDDGPHMGNTSRILDLLAEQGWRAAFFVVGGAIRRETYPLVQRMVREQHTIGNHSYHHRYGLPDGDNPDASLTLGLIEYAMTQALVDIALLATSADDFDAMTEELFGPKRRFAHMGARNQLRAWPEFQQRWQSLLERRSTPSGAHPYVMQLLRPPGGTPCYGSPARAVARLGVVAAHLKSLVVMWNGGSGDSSAFIPPAERYSVQGLMGRTLRSMRRGGVVVLHDRISMYALEKIFKKAATLPAISVVPLSSLIAAKTGWDAAAVTERLDARAVRAQSFAIERLWKGKRVAPVTAVPAETAATAPAEQATASPRDGTPQSPRPAAQAPTAAPPSAPTGAGSPPSAPRP